MGLDWLSRMHTSRGSVISVFDEAEGVVQVYNPKQIVPDKHEKPDRRATTALTRKEANDMHTEAIEAFLSESPLSISLIAGTATEDAETRRYPAN